MSTIQCNIVSAEKEIFSENLITPNLPVGFTAVTVHILLFERWFSSKVSMLTFAKPSPYVRKNLSSLRYFLIFEILLVAFI